MKKTLLSSLTTFAFAAQVFAADADFLNEAPSAGAGVAALQAVDES
jgi:hypothetical protein